ncbi:MAG: deoxyribose-phosphate aldolase [Hyphomicrobiales bacterium]
MKHIAARALALLDFTNLNDDCTTADIDDLCNRAATPHGHVAAVCLFPAFIECAKENLAGSQVKIVTVANFPEGESGSQAAAEECSAAISKGADEVDIVIPWRAVLDGNDGTAASVVKACRKAVPKTNVLKVILETGELNDQANIRRAACIALDEGADFLKTSTGKVPVNATPEAATILLEEIAKSGRPVGFKAAGGLRTIEDAATYLSIADQIMGEDWATPETFRFGASSILNVLLATLDGTAPAATSEGY